MGQRQGWELRLTGQEVGASNITPWGIAIFRFPAIVIRNPILAAPRMRLDANVSVST
jgi:hypothetical protein